MIKVFLVDDHHIMRRGLASLLTAECDVQILGEAASGEEALARLPACELPDVMIIDVSLPGMNGIETARKVKALYQQVKILMLSMYNNPTFVHQALQAGASSYILKQSMVEELNTALVQVAQGKQFISPMITANLDPTVEYTTGSLDALTHRELEVFSQLTRGTSVKDIAEELVVSIYTVYTHLNNIKRKLGVEQTSDLVRYALENPLILTASDQSEAKLNPLEES